jgi:hypothetical protein
LEEGVDCFRHFFGWHDWDDLKIDKVLPPDHPLLEESRVVAFHELEAAIKIRLYPAVDVLQTVWEHATLFRKATVHGASVSVLEPLNYNEKHTNSKHKTYGVN